LLPRRIVIQDAAHPTTSAARMAKDLVREHNHAMKTGVPVIE
jgi:hypothetical protein